MVLERRLRRRIAVERAAAGRGGLAMRIVDAEPQTDRAVTVLAAARVVAVGAVGGRVAHAQLALIVRAARTDARVAAAGAHDLGRLPRAALGDLRAADDGRAAQWVQRVAVLRAVALHRRAGVALAVALG